MKISISGSFCTGKTSLCRALVKMLPNVHIVEETATVAKQLHPSLDWRLADVRSYLYWSQVIAERQAESQSALVILDGSLVDVFAHCTAFDMAIPIHWRDLNLPAYDLTVVCDPTGVDIEDNRLRELDPSLRLRIHQLVVEEAPVLSKGTLLVSGSLDERVRAARSEICRLAC